MDYFIEIESEGELRRRIANFTAVDKNGWEIVADLYGQTGEIQRTRCDELTIDISNLPKETTKIKIRIL